jgi:hypothetical protein
VLAYLERATMAGSGGDQFGLALAIKHLALLLWAPAMAGLTLSCGARAEAGGLRPAMFWRTSLLTRSLVPRSLSGLQPIFLTCTPFWCV